MINAYPDHKTYRALYLRYLLGRNEGDLLELVELKPGDRLLDLCCGEGQMTLQAVIRGAGEVVAVDAAPQMINRELWDQGSRVRVLTMSVRDALQQGVSGRELFDGVVCRQAVNYWLDEETAALTAAVLKSGGVFAFNTFNEKPSIAPRVREYNLQGHDFMEISWLVGLTVHHLQVRDGLKPHYTTFQWLSPERLNALLESYFLVFEKRHGKTSLYWCMKK
jgi:2-polyprenyl-3-methyl-5-hydroxy-6-metoxy-1,4-benzoquinol methylase